MGIKIRNSNVVGIYRGSLPIIAVYAAGLKVWPPIPLISEILSCYYNGYWMDEYPWTDDTPWVD